MSVAAHLHIRLEEYDSRIQTFIPRYDEMLDAASRALQALHLPSPRLVDLGTGTGALAARCLAARPGARVTAVDADPDILTLARQRLGALDVDASFVCSRFDEMVLPPCDAIVASLSLHHIRTTVAKRQMYRRCREALSAGGVLISADCCPASDERLASLQRAAWRDHLRLSYSDAEADGFFAAWAEEDVYFTLDGELAMIADAGFVTDVVWRTGAMAVILACAVAPPAAVRHD